MTPRLAVFGILIITCLLISTISASGDKKTLYWQDFVVVARLDNDGILHITETQTIVFDGDWNGGERMFTVRPGQSFSLQGLYRTTLDGTQVRLQQGSLSKIDKWDWHQGHTLRWRSRLASDPPFRKLPITYTIEYSLSKILLPLPDGRFSLSQDFAFTKRSGIIRHFSLELSADDGWDQGAFPVTISKEDIPPGQTVVVTAALNHLRGGPPQVYQKPSRLARPVPLSRSPAPLWLALSCGLMLLLILAWCSLSFFLYESRNGRFLPPPDPADIDEDWMEQHIFNLLPETIGATWDKKTTGHEVAAVLARLVVEGKMSSRLEPVILPILNWHIPGQFILHLSLLKPRNEFSGYERKLIDGFFIDGDTTDTKRIRAFYRKKGSSFLPAEKIRAPLENRVEQLTRALKNRLEYRWLIPLAGFAIGFFIFLINGFVHPDELPLTIGGGIAGFMGLIVGSANGYNYRSRSDRLVWRITTLYFMVLVMSVAFFGLYFFGASSLLTCGLFFLFGSALYATFYNAKSRDSLEGVQLCKNLSSGRQYLKAELRKKHPAIKDEWFPYLLAFGLGPEVDKWTHAFHPGQMKSTTMPNSSSGGSSGFTGGGGSFGGAGASGSWGTAATSLGSSSSSSSSSSGGGGGSSSGGGGGGGW